MWPLPATISIPRACDNVPRSLGIAGGRTRQSRGSLAIGLTAAVVLVDFALLPFAPFSIVWWSFQPVLFWLVVMGVIWAVYTLWRPAPPLATAAVATAQILLFTLAAAILNYLGFMAGRPSFDASFVAADHLIGFDWLHFVSWVSSVPYANDVLLPAYHSSIPQVSAIVVFLALSGRFERLDRFTLSFMITALMLVAFWTAFPTFGAYIYYFSLGEAVPDHGLAVYPSYARAVIDMQNGVFSPLRFDNILGLIGFPSFHTSFCSSLRLRALGHSLVGADRRARQSGRAGVGSRAGRAPSGRRFRRHSRRRDCDLAGGSNPGRAPRGTSAIVRRQSRLTHQRWPLVPERRRSPASGIALHRRNGPTSFPRL